MKFSRISCTFLFTCLIFTSCIPSSKQKEGKVLNIACWNEEFKTRFNDYFVAKGLLPENIKVNWIMVPNEGNEYQNKLDELLVAQKELSPNERLDIFLVEADYALKYSDTPYTLDVKKDIGLTDEDLSSQYKYTQDIMTNSSGALKGVSWQACPGGFIYRRSIARKVLGTDSPDEVQKVLDSWQKFDSLAEKVKEAGFFMLAGPEDSFRVFSDNASTPFVKGNKLTVPQSIKQWIAQSKKYTQLGYNSKARLWSKESFEGAGPEGKVFGYFGPAWFIDYCLMPASLQFPNGEHVEGNGTYGDWAFCKGPQAFSWGGTWICAASGTDNKKLIHKIMYTLTCKRDTMASIAKEVGDFTNNEQAMNEVAESDYQNPFLGGQNHIKPFLENAKSIRKECISPYDQGLSEKLHENFWPYFEGNITEKQAWENFYSEIEKLYPNLDF